MCVRLCQPNCKLRSLLIEPHMCSKDEALPHDDDMLGVTDLCLALSAVTSDVISIIIHIVQCNLSPHTNTTHTDTANSHQRSSTGVLWYYIVFSGGFLKHFFLLVLIHLEFRYVEYKSWLGSISYIKNCI